MLRNAQEEMPERAQTALDLLSSDMRSFPSQFLLFIPHVQQLALDDRVAATHRNLRVSSDRDSVITLEDGATTERWVVRRIRHTPSPEAQKDAGELAGRDSVEIQWAVPMQNRSKLGSFWAFFPTEARTTLSGIINAPWKLDDARRLLLEGRFNQELLTEVLPKLVAKDFQKLAVDGEPATALDILPARGREGRNWADDAINEPIFDELRKVPSLPNCSMKSAARWSPRWTWPAS